MTNIKDGIMYTCNYNIGEKQYFTEVFADSQEEALEKASDMFGDSLEVLMEMPDKDTNEILMDEVKAIYVKGHKGILKKPGMLDINKFSEMTKRREKDMEEQLETPETYKGLLAMIQLSVITERMENKFEDKKDREFMIACYKIGVMGNFMCTDDYKEIMEITNRKPQLLHKDFSGDVKRYYKGNLMKLKHFFKREQTIALTCYGLGRASTKALLDTDYDKFCDDLMSLKAGILQEKKNK